MMKRRNPLMKMKQMRRIQTAQLKRGKVKILRK
jgi:hypothetical protein